MSRRFEVIVAELSPGETADVAGIGVQTAEGRHPSGAPALILRLDLRGTIIAYTGDTAWTPAIATAAAGADLLIAEAYYWDKPVPHHLRHADLVDHGPQLGARRTVLTHMSADMLARHGAAGSPTARACHETAHDGLVVQV